MVRQIHMQSSSTNDQMKWTFTKDKQVWKGEFSNGDMIHEDLIMNDRVTWDSVVIYRCTGWNQNETFSL